MRAVQTGLLSLTLVSCQNPQTRDSFPDLLCPGDPGCATAEGPLRAGVARVSITPTGFDPAIDRDGDGLFDGRVDTYTDANDNGDFDAVWLGGSFLGRAAAGIKDDLYATALVFEKGETKVALVSLDTVGFFRDDLERIRRALPTSLGIDQLIVASTHNHQGPDTLGPWGRIAGRSGVDPEWMAKTRDAVVEVVTAAAESTQPAKLRLATVDTRHPVFGVEAYLSDVRSPRIVDPRMTLLQVVADTGDIISTLVHWSSHPEYLGLDNNLISSDFVGALRQGLEAAHVGIPVYFSGALGGQVGPARVRIPRADGTFIEKDGEEKVAAIGDALARLALEALTHAELVANPNLKTSRKIMSLELENRAWLLGWLLEIYPRSELETYDPTLPTSEQDLTIETEVSYLEVGPFHAITTPGELFPESWIGGYDGTIDNGQPFVDDVPNPPPLQRAPKGPYLRDVVGGKYPVLLGLAQDTLGYIVPAYDFRLHDRTPYFEMAEGEHYEETFSASPTIESELVGTMAELAQTSRE